MKTDALKIKKLKLKFRAINPSPVKQCQRFASDPQNPQNPQNMLI